MVSLVKGLPEPPEFVCAYCGETIERRDGEWVQKFSDDPQCDDSPIGKGNHFPRPNAKGVE